MQVPDDPDRPSNDGSSPIIGGHDDHNTNNAHTPIRHTTMVGSRIPRRISDTNTNGANGIRGMSATRQHGDGAHNPNHGRSSGEGSSGDGNSALDELDALNRIRSDSSLLAHVRDWNDHDVGRFYDIVLEAERILPTLPGRGQQPTIALFQALESVLQRSGEEASNDTKFTPLIFKVGVEPGTGLVDKAKKVFDRLGFEVEWVPDDLTENLDFYQSVDSTQLNPDLPPGSVPSQDHILAPDRDSRHVRWRDESGNPAGPGRLHDSFTYDRPSSYSGSNPGSTRDGSGSPSKANTPDIEHVERKEGEDEDEDEKEEISNSFDTYYSEEHPPAPPAPPAPRIQPHPPTPARRLSNGVHSTPFSNDESSSFIASPSTPDKQEGVRATSENNPQLSPSRRKGATSPSSGHFPSRQGDELVQNPNSNDEPSPQIVPMPQSPRPPKSSIVVKLPPILPQGYIQVVERSPKSNTSGIDGQHPPGGAHSPVEPPAVYPSSSPSVVAQSRHDRGAALNPPVVANGHRTEDNTANSTVNLTAPVPQVPMFRAHVQKFRHQLFLRKWKDLAIATRDARREQEAEAHRFFNVRLADSTLFNWRSQARVQWERRVQMEQSAYQFDGRKLGETTLELWREKTVVKQHERAAYEAREHDTEIFFENLEMRAERAYNFYIMTKALTHWAVRAQEEKGRTETARRHIMRIRYFDSWKQYTAVNELKVRQFATKKIFSVLKQHLLARRQKTQTAIQLYQHKLVEKVFRKWQRLNRGNFVRFICNMNLIKAVLSRWLHQTRGIRAQRSNSQSQAGQTALRGLLSAWKDVARVKLEREQVAQNFRDRHLLLRIFDRWDRRTELQQVCNRFIAAKNRRLVQEATQVWSRKAKLEQKARALDYVKTGRATLLRWTMKKRTQQFQRQVDQRILSETMYKWFIAEHESLLIRAREHRLKQNILQALRYSTAATRDVDQRNHQIAWSFHDHQLKIQPFKAWYGRLDRLTRMEQQADQFYRYHLKQRIWRILHYRATVRADQAAEAGRQYQWVTCNKLFQKWKTSQEQAYKQKLSAGYKTCRRTTKINVVRRVLAQLNARAFHRAQQEYVAEQLARHESQEKARRALQIWRLRTEQVQSIESRGYNVLQVSVLGKWRQQLTHREMNDARAREFHRDKRLHSVIRAWSLKGLQLRAREHTAMEVQERSNRTALRKILEEWYSVALQRVQARDAEEAQVQHTNNDPPPPPPGPSGDSGGDGGAGRQHGPTPQASVQGAPTPRNSNYPAASSRGASLYGGTPTPSGNDHFNSRHNRAETHGSRQGIETPAAQEPNPFYNQSPRKKRAMGGKSVGNIIRRPAGGSYFIRRRGGSLPDGRQPPSALVTHRILGPYPPFDEDEENQPPLDEVELEPLQPDVPTEEEDGILHEQPEGSRAPSRSYSREGASTPTPLRFNTRMPSTTPLAPLPTPFEKQLREQYGSNSPSVTEITTERPGSRVRFTPYSNATTQVPVATGLNPPGRTVPGGSSSSNNHNDGSVAERGGASNRSSLPVPRNGRLLKGVLAVNGKRSVGGRVRFTGDIRSVSDSSTDAVVEGSRDN